MNRIRIICFNIALGSIILSRFILPLWLLSTVFRSFYYARFQLWNNPFHMWLPDSFWTGNQLEMLYNHFHAFFTSPLLLIVNFKTRHYSLFHMKITASVTRSSYQDRGRAIYTYPFFSCTYILLFCYKKLLWLLFSSAN